MDRKPNRNSESSKKENTYKLGVFTTAKKKTKCNSTLNITDMIQLEQYW